MPRQARSPVASPTRRWSRPPSPGPIRTGAASFRAAGNSGVEFDPDRVDIYLQSTLVCEAGCAADFSESKLKRQMDESEVSVRFVIKGRSGGEARFWTCDFTEDYIRINASYRT